MSERIEVPLVPCEHNRQWWASFDGDRERQDRICLIPCSQCLADVFKAIARTLGSKFAAECEQRIIAAMLDE